MFHEQSSTFLCESFWFFVRFFKCDVRLLQGETISPKHFSLFLADLDTFIQFDADVGITLEQISFCLLIFADDAVFFS